MNRIISYKPFNKAGFEDSKKCSIANIDIPNKKRATKVQIYDTSSTTPTCFNQSNEGDIVTFDVEFIPTAEGTELLAKADDLVRDVLNPKYKPEPCTITTKQTDDSIDTIVTIYDVFIKQVKLYVNRKDESKNELGYIRMKFTLEGLLADK